MAAAQYTFTHKKKYIEQHNLQFWLEGFLGFEPRMVKLKLTMNYSRKMGRVRAVPRLCELYRGICLTHEENARENLSQGSRRAPVLKYTFCIFKNNFQYIYIYICRRFSDKFVNSFKIYSINTIKHFVLKILH